MHIHESTHTLQHPFSWRRKARVEAQVRQGRVREGEEADKKMGAKNFKFFDRFFAPPPKIVRPFRQNRAPNLRRPAQESLKSSAGNGQTFAQASADFAPFPAQEAARICAAGSLSRNLTNITARSNQESRIVSIEEGSTNEGGEEEAQRKTMHIQSYILTAVGNSRKHEIGRVYFNARE